MDKLIYLIVIFISKLPFTWLYKLSDLFFFINHYIICYRGKVIQKNLKNSFPEKSQKEINQIHKKFNQNFADYVFESLKGLTANSEEIEQRIICDNPDLIKKYTNKDKNLMVLSGHVFNFEWYPFFAKDIEGFEGLYFIYKPLKNKYLNKKVNELRSRFNGIGISAKKTYSTIAKIPNNGKHLFYFLADQSPNIYKARYFIQFLNQETAVFKGFEDIVRKYNYNVLFIEGIKDRRGYYRMILKEIKPNNEINFEEGEMLEKYFALLTMTLKKHPDNWLWSHKRWKYTKKEVEELNRVSY